MFRGILGSNLTSWIACGEILIFDFGENGSIIEAYSIRSSVTAIFYSQWEI